MIEFIVPTAAIGKARPRVTRHGTYTPKETRDYEELVRHCFRTSGSLPYTDASQPLKAEIVACFTVPKSYSKKKHAEPDDAQITALEVGKFYSDRDFVLIKIHSEEETNHAHT